MKLENNILTNQGESENNGAAGENTAARKVDYPEVSIKTLVAAPEVQEAFRRYVAVPDVVTVKKVRNPFENKETGAITQKIVAMSGTTIEDAVSLELTLSGPRLDPVEAINKKYRIMDYTFALEANMSEGRFGGYAAKGLKLTVTKLEKIEVDGK